MHTKKRPTLCNTTYKVIESETDILQKHHKHVVHQMFVVVFTWTAALHLNVMAERDIRGSAGLQGDWVAVEVLQHVYDILEPQVVHMTLAPGVHRETQVLQGNTHTHMCRKHRCHRIPRAITQSYGTTIHPRAAED